MCARLEMLCDSHSMIMCINFFCSASCIFSLAICRKHQHVHQNRNNNNSICSAPVRKQNLQNAQIGRNKKCVTHEAYFCRYFNFKQCSTFSPIYSHLKSKTMFHCYATNLTDTFYALNRTIFVGMQTAHITNVERETEKKPFCIVNTINFTLFCCITTSAPKMQLCECCLMHLAAKSFMLDIVNVSITSFAFLTTKSFQACHFNVYSKRQALTNIALITMFKCDNRTKQTMYPLIR